MHEKLRETYKARIIKHIYIYIETAASIKAEIATGAFGTKYEVCYK